jgi:glucokinase
MSNGRLSVGVDIGGTKVAAGVVDEEGTILAELRRSTPTKDVTETENVISEVVQELRASYEVVAVGIGAAGWIASDRATVLFSPHLAWRNEPLRDALSERVGVPVTVENDANSAAWAEYRFGAATGEPVVACVTLGTGIGGGLVVAGTLFRGGFGVAPEWGHMCMVPGGRRCACGNRGCWEMYASGTALARDARELADVSPVAAHRLLQLVDGDASKLTGHEVRIAAQEGDPGALEIFRSMGRRLGEGLADLSAVLDPTCMVIGGGVAEAGDLLLEPARGAYAESLTGRGFRPLARIELARFGPMAGLVGAADLARRRV